MRRLPTMFASASAAALATLAITVAVPALADDPGGSSKAPDRLPACLRDHGLTGTPDGDALKSWVGARLERGDATTERAMEKCVPKPAIVEAPGPDDKDVRSCLTERGVALPEGDGVALKRWLLAHADEAANRDAMKACHILPPGKPGGDGPRGKEEGVLEVVRCGRVDKPAPDAPRGTGEPETSGAN